MNLTDTQTTCGHDAHCLAHGPTAGAMVRPAPAFFTPEVLDAGVPSAPHSPSTLSGACEQTPDAPNSIAWTIHTARLNRQRALTALAVDKALWLDKQAAAQRSMSTRGYSEACEHLRAINNAVLQWGPDE